MMKIKLSSFLLILVTGLLSLVLLLSVTKGDKGRPIYYQSQFDSRVGGPFESSNSTSRYSLTKTLAEGKNVFFDEKLARFSAPDVVYYNNTFFSIFTPGISFIAVPFYLLGKYFNMPQLFSYFSVGIFLILNVFLVALISRKFGASLVLSLFAGFVFAFGTNALSYSLTLTQHLTSTAIVLLALLNAVGKRNLLTNILFGVFCGIGALVDIPNLFFLTPMGLYVLYKNINFRQTKEMVSMAIRPSVMGIIIGVLPFIVLFGVYNHKTTGSYTLLGQSIGQSNYFDSPEQKKEKELRDSNDNKEKKSSLPFKTRNQLRGLYIFGISNERSWLYYSPVVLVGIIGLIIAFLKKRGNALVTLSITVGLLNFALYSMFGDPWGGWSFGPRYLIPTSAILSVGLAYFLHVYRRRILLIIPVVLLLGYSVYITFLGALTTNAIPPKPEALALIQPIPHTYQYNFEFLHLNQSGSLFYNLYLKGNVDLWMYHLTLVGLVLVFMVTLLTVAVLSKNDK